MATIQRNVKTFGTRSFVGEVSAAPSNYAPILSNEVDADLDTVYAAWNGGADSVNLKDGSVTSAKIAPLNVDSPQIKDGAVTTAKLGPLSVATSHLQDGSVTWEKRGVPTYARITQHVLPTLSTGVVTMLTFNTTEVAQGLSPAADRITVSVNGFYLIGGSASFDRSSGGSQRLIQLLVNGAVVAQQDTGTGTFAGLVISVGYYLLAASYVQLRAYQDSGANLALVGPDWPALWVARIG